MTESVDVDSYLRANIRYYGTDEGSRSQELQEAGWDAPGWYLRDMAGDTLFGPFQSAGEASVAGRTYLESLGGPPRFVTPEVHWVGYSQLNEQGLRSYLIRSGNFDFVRSMDKAREQGLSDAEILCSFFAKLCYRSLTLGKNTNVSRTRDIWDNLVNCFDTAHGSIFEHVNFNFVVDRCSRVFCFAENTELLTKDGWKPVAEITLQDVLLTKNPQTGLDEWERPIDVHSFRYTGRMVGWGTSQGSSPAVTANHLLWAAPYDLRCYRGMKCEEIVLEARKIVAEELFGKRIVVDNTIRLARPEIVGETIQVGEHHYDAYLLFCWLGWMATDGGFSKDRPNQCTIMQSKTQHWPELELLMSQLFEDRWRSHGPYVTERGETCRLFVISDAALAAWAKTMIGPDKLSRDLRPLFVASPRLLRGFLDAAMKGDGNVHEQHGHEVIYTPSEAAAGHYQVLVSLVGKCATVREDDRTGESHYVGQTLVTHRRPCYVVSISRKTASLISRQHWQEYEAEDEPVYCPQTRNGVVFARAGGKLHRGLPVWSGNTHELVRHRIGTAFSQTSGRYCRLDHIPIVWDPILDPVKDLFEDCLANIEKTVYLAECRLGLRKPPGEYPNAKPESCLPEGNANGYGSPAQQWVPDNSFDFTLRKKLTSAIRRIAPNGQSNEIGFSVNLRSLRHTILMRTARHAEWEIRHVFDQVYRLLRDSNRYPLIFHGAKENVVDGLIEVSGMRMQPYEKTAQMVLSEMSDEEIQLYLQTRGQAS